MTRTAEVLWVQHDWISCNMKLEINGYSAQVLSTLASCHNVSAYAPYTQVCNRRDFNCLHPSGRSPDPPQISTSHHHMGLLARLKRKWKGMEGTLEEHSSVACRCVAVCPILQLVHLAYPTKQTSGARCRVPSPPRLSKQIVLAGRIGREKKTPGRGRGLPGLESV